MHFIIIENNPSQALVFEAAGIDRIMVDLETLGKAERQRGLNSVKSNHTFEDIVQLRKKLSISALMVRTNPWNINSSYEIDEVISCGADIIMLPMFKKLDETESFVRKVNLKAKTILLLETPQALVKAEEIMKKGGFDELFIGLNDLSLAMSLDFMFELLAGGIIDYIATLCKKYHVIFGFGGIGTLNSGEISGLSIIQQHARLESSSVILSQTFKRTIKEANLDLKGEIDQIRKAYANSLTLTPTEHDFFRQKIFTKIWEISRKNSSRH